MPIEFACSSCRKLLRVPDSAVGGKARCPHCMSVNTVLANSASAGGQSLQGKAAAQPDSSLPQPPAGGLPAGPAPVKQSANPFESPQMQPAYAPAYGHNEIANGPIRNQVADIGRIIEYAFERWKENLGLLVGITVVVMAINYAIGGVLKLAEYGLENANDDGLALVLVIAIILGNLFSSAVQIFLGIGQVKIALKIARGQQAAFNDLFSAGRLFWPVLGASILAGIALLFGFLLLIVPGILLILFFWPFYYLIVDEKTGVFQSFEIAREVTRNNVGTTFLLWLVSLGVGVLGLLACGVGLIFAAPLISMFWGVAYLMMSGQISLAPLPGSRQFQPPQPS